MSASLSFIYKAPITWDRRFFAAAIFLGYNAIISSEHLSFSSSTRSDDQSFE